MNSMPNPIVGPSGGGGGSSVQWSSATSGAVGAPASNSFDEAARSGGTRGYGRGNWRGRGRGGARYNRGGGSHYQSNLYGGPNNNIPLSNYNSSQWSSNMPSNRGRYQHRVIKGSNYYDRQSEIGDENRQHQQQQNPLLSDPTSCPLPPMLFNQPQSMPLNNGQYYQTQNRNLSGQENSLAEQLSSMNLNSSARDYEQPQQAHSPNIGWEGSLATQGQQQQQGQFAQMFYNQLASNNPVYPTGYQPYDRNYYATPTNGTTYYLPVASNSSTSAPQQSYYNNICIDPRCLCHQQAIYVPAGGYQSYLSSAPVPYNSLVMPATNSGWKAQQPSGGSGVNGGGSGSLPYSPPTSDDGTSLGADTLSMQNGQGAVGSGGVNGGGHGKF